MNFSLYLFGTPSSYIQYPADSNNQLFNSFYQKQQTDSQLTIYRNGQLVYYTYIHKLSQNNFTNYFGLCLIFNGTYCLDIKKLYELFDKAFSDISLQGKILQIDKKGKISFVVNQFANEPHEIERIKLFFRNYIERDFIKDFITLKSDFKVGNGTKTLSLRDENKDILTAIRQYDCVFVSNTEKSDSELDRIHKMLSDVYSEKQHLETKYKTLLGQKKQYKVVMVLCFAIMCCILGLVLFNQNLQSKESKLNSLQTELNEKNEIISNQLSDIAQLQIIQSRKSDTISIQNYKIVQSQIEQLRLSDEIDSLKNDNNQKNTTIDEKITEIYDLNGKISSFTLENNSLKQNITNLNNQNRKLNSEISSIKSAAVQQYKVVVTKSNCYRQCAGKYYDAECYYSYGAIVNVYTQQDGYGLTVGGYLKMYELQKY